MQKGRSISQTITESLRKGAEVSHTFSGSNRGGSNPLERTKAQVDECLAYYEDHRGEMDVLVARQMAPVDRVCWPGGL
jgi:hypothetical protein